MTEEERILAEVQRRRERAKELGLCDLLTLFHDHLEFLEEGPNPERLPAYVTDVKVLDTRSGGNSVQMRVIFFREKPYLFAFKKNYGTDPSGNPDVTGNLMVSTRDQTLLDLSYSGEEDQWLGTVWRAPRVEAFIEGDWVQEITAFTEEVLALADQRHRRCATENKKKELENLKSKFGLS